MISTKNIEKIYIELISKIRYDSINNIYYIDILDYLKYNLTQKEIKELKIICNKNNILLITLPKILTQKETNLLFDKLIILKEQLNIESNNLKKEQLAKEIYSIRTNIFLGHQLIVYRILLNIYPDIINSQDKEDIIQSGYIDLINAIDSFDPKKAVSFRWYLYQYTSSHIKRTTFYINNDLIKLIETREILKENITIEELSQKTKLTETRIKELLVLEQILNPDNIEDINEFSDDNIIELQIYNNIFKELIKMIIETLPNKKQQQVLKLYYGIDNNIARNTNEIAKILGLLRQRVEQHKQDGMDILRHPTRARYIKEIIETYTKDEYQLLKYIETNTILKDKTYEQLELFLLSRLPKQELYELINSLNKKYHKVLLTHFELINNEYSYIKKIELLEISINTYLKLKKIGLERLRNIIIEKYSLDKNNENSYLDFLMYSYLNQTKIKVKRK